LVQRVDVVRASMKELAAGSVTSPRGFQASGITAALLLCDTPAQFAAAFTQNAFAAPPVRYCQDLCQRVPHLRALIINSGNANCCTGARGLQDARRMADLTAELLGLTPDEVMVFSTGRIGVPMPMAKVEQGIRLSVPALTHDGGTQAAHAIMTTDTKPKSLAVEIEIGGVPVRLGGMAKGAGMIAPNMKLAGAPHATMLAYLTTDAVLAPGLLAQVLGASLDESFNRVTIDGDTSTNDSFVALASGAAGNPVIQPGTPEAASFAAAFNHLAAQLSRLLVLDGEGATRFVHVEVSGALNREQGRRCAMAIANSLLCKTAWFGADPNWGRILDAAGYSDVAIVPEKVTLDYDELPIVRQGGDAGTPEALQTAIIKRPEFHIRLNLGAGEASYTVWTCDLSYEYVKINADYHT
jgi:glutamate N-acetyltransferase / amino-acid N-acetyltransferase